MSWKKTLNKKEVMLPHLLLNKYKMKESIKKAEMMKIVTRSFKQHFSELLRISEHMELVFGLDLQETDSKGETYTLLSKLETTKEEVMGGGRDFPKNRILLPLLGMIYTNGLWATEENVWEYLRKMGVYHGQKHNIYREPRNLNTNDLVKEKFLQYRQVPDSDPPCYKFLWGPRAHAQATKKAVLGFVAESSDTDPSVLEVQCEEASRSEEGRATGRESTGAGPSASAGLV